MANDDPAYHRTLNLVKLPYGDLEYIQSRGHGDIFEKAGLMTAYQFQKRALVPIVAGKKKDQEFSKYATGWEKLFSKLCSSGKFEFDPVLDKNGMVIGHYGWMWGNNIFINPKKDLPGRNLYTGGLDELLRNETRVYILKENIRWHNDHDQGHVYKPIGFADQSWRVVTDIFGQVVTYTHYKNREELESCYVTPLDIFVVGRLANLAVKGIRKVIGSIATRLAAKEAGVVTSRILTEEAEVVIEEVVAKEVAAIPVQAKKVMQADMLIWEKEGGHALQNHGPQLTRDTLKTRIGGRETIPAPQMQTGGYKPKDLRVWRGDKAAAASKWTSDDEMRRTIGEVLDKNIDEIRRATGPGGPGEIVLRNNLGRKIGEGWVCTAPKGAEQAAFWDDKLTGVTMVIRRRVGHVVTGSDPEPWYVHTVFPDFFAGG